MFVAVVGGYALTSAAVAVLAALMVLAFGAHRSEATLLAAMLGFPIYLLALLWAVSLRRTWHAIAWMLGGVLAMHGALYLLSHDGAA